MKHYKISVASDHRGFKLKAQICSVLVELGHEAIDRGPHNSFEPCDYPMSAAEVCEDVLLDAALGILICGTGIGMSIAANKFKGIRAARCVTTGDVEAARKHNNANVLCLPESVCHVRTMITAWINTDTEATGEDECRHTRRLKQIADFDDV